MPPSGLPEPGDDISRRQVVKLGVVAGVASAARSVNADSVPGILKARAATDPVKFGMIGTGNWGTYLLGHLAKIDDAHCVALSDTNPDALAEAVNRIGTNPKTYKDYRGLLSDSNVEAVFIAVPLYIHFPLIRDALLAGKHVFCEKSLVFTPQEVHALRALAREHSKQTLQVGLQRRYSIYFQSVKSMIDQSILGNVTHMYAQWHRNPGWTMKEGGKNNPKNWRLFREFSGGLTAELASHQVDVADWFFGAHPDFVLGLGSLDTWRDGRDINDNIQLIYGYPNGRKLIYSAISTNQHLPILGGQHAEFGIVVMGTAGAIEITAGSDDALPTALWYKEPIPTMFSPAAQERAEKKAGTAFTQARTQKGIPIISPDTEVDWQNDSFLTRESKLARGWLYSKGIMLPQEDRNPVDNELHSFFADLRSGSRPKADVEVGLADSTAVMLSNLAMDENRRVLFSEIDQMGLDTTEAMARQIARS